jgi:prepilin-type N-terminal cleavage/methylation domain-containing protein
VTSVASRNGRREGFSLIEVVTALSILALAASSVLVVIDRCVASTSDSMLRMHAFETARDNMEKLLTSNSVEETVEYGASEKYPDIEWETVVETFYEPISNRMWVRAVCSAEYEDSQGETQAVELTHWLTNVSKQQLLKLMEQQEQEEQELAADQLIETIEDAAEYAGVDEDTIEQWLDNGMLTTDDGSFIRRNLDLYNRTNGKPSDEEMDSQAESITDLREQMEEDSARKRSLEKENWKDQIDPATGLTQGEVENMGVKELFELLQSKKAKGP